MKPKIDLSESTILHVVWELENGYWEILSIVRLKSAIALVRESPSTRLVFPTEIKPNGVWGGIYRNRSTKTNSKKVNSLQKRQERVLALLKNSPGQTRDALASLLGVSVATFEQLLRKLEKQNEIHYHPHPADNKTKLYYAGKALPTTGTLATTSSTSKALPRLRKEPPLKVYFVEPKTLQPLSQ